MKDPRICLVVVAGALILAGCQKTKTPDTTDRTGKDSGFSDAPVLMRMAWWGGESRHNATLKVIEAYQQLHSNVKIEGEYIGSTGPYLTKLLTQTAGNTAPDIIQVDFKWLKSFTDQKQNFVDFNSYADRIDTSQIDQKIINTYCTRDGFWLGLPIGLNALCINTNVNALKEIGIEFPKVPSWDDIIKMGKAVQQKDPSKYLLWLQQGHYFGFFKSFIFQRTGTNPFNEEEYSINFTRADVVDYFIWLKELFETKTVAPLEETVVYGKVFANEIPSWHDQKYLSVSGGASTMTTLINATKFETSVARWPVIAGAKAFGAEVPVISMMFSVSSHSSNIDWAIDFMALPAIWWKRGKNAIVGTWKRQ